MGRSPCRQANGRHHAAAGTTAIRRHTLRRGSPTYGRSRRTPPQTWLWDGGNPGHARTDSVRTYVDGKERPPFALRRLLVRFRFSAGSARYSSVWSTAISSRRGSCWPFHDSRRRFTPSARSGRLYSSRSHFSKSPRAKCSTISRLDASFRCSMNDFGSSVRKANQLAGPDPGDPSRPGLKTRSFKAGLVSKSECGRYCGAENTWRARSPASADIYDAMPTPGVTGYPRHMRSKLLVETAWKARRPAPERPV